MIIEYKGHSCFRIKDFQNTGYKIVFDPYEKGSVPGYKPCCDDPDLRANIVLVSHQHHDHNAVNEVTIVQEDIENPFDIQKIETFHDPEKGALRGPNTIHVVTLRESGEKVIHYGDIGENIDDLLTPENLELLENADYAMIPIGGTYTYDFGQAIELIECTHPKTAIAMHFRSNAYNCGLENIGAVEDFMIFAMENCHEVHMAGYTYHDTVEDKESCEILALKPEYV